MLNGYQRLCYPTVLKAVKEAADETKSKIKPNEDIKTLHNQYLNEFCRALTPKLNPEGINFEKEKKIKLQGRTVKPDLYVDLLAIIEVKVKSNGIDQAGIRQMEKYQKATRLPGIMVSFGTSGKAHIREFPILW